MPPPLRVELRKQRPARARLLDRRRLSARYPDEMRRWFVALALVAAWGCSLGALDGFSGGSGGGDAAAPDATSEANNGGDAASTADAEIDVVVTPPEPLTPCATSTSTLCRDFEQGPVDQGFDGIEARGTQTLAIVDGGLHVRLDQLSAGKGIARLAKNIPGGAKRTRVSFDLLVKPPNVNVSPVNGYFSIAEFLCGPEGDQHGAWLQFVPNDGGVTLAVRGNTFTHRMSAPPTATRVTLDVRWEATYADVAVFYGTQLALGKRLDNVTCATKAPFRLVIGLSSSHLGEATYDNVVYDLDPQ